MVKVKKLKSLPRRVTPSAKLERGVYTTLDSDISVTTVINDAVFVFNSGFDRLSTGQVHDLLLESMDIEDIYALKDLRYLPDGADSALMHAILSTVPSPKKNLPASTACLPDGIHPENSWARGARILRPYYAPFSYLDNFRYLYSDERSGTSQESSVYSLGKSSRHLLKSLVKGMPLLSHMIFKQVSESIQNPSTSVNNRNLRYVSPWGSAVLHRSRRRGREYLEESVVKLFSHDIMNYYGLGNEYINLLNPNVAINLITSPYATLSSFNNYILNRSKLPAALSTRDGPNARILKGIEPSSALKDLITKQLGSLHNVSGNLAAYSMAMSLLPKVTVSTGTASLLQEVSPVRELAESTISLNTVIPEDHSDNPVPFQSLTQPISMVSPVFDQGQVSPRMWGTLTNQVMGNVLQTGQGRPVNPISSYQASETRYNIHQNLPDAGVLGGRSCPDDNRGTHLVFGREGHIDSYATSIHSRADVRYGSERSRVSFKLSHPIAEFPCPVFSTNGRNMMDKDLFPSWLISRSNRAMLGTWKESNDSDEYSVSQILTSANAYNSRLMQSGSEKTSTSYGFGAALLNAHAMMSTLRSLAEAPPVVTDKVLAAAYMASKLDLSQTPEDDIARVREHRLHDVLPLFFAEASIGHPRSPYRTHSSSAFYSTLIATLTSGNPEDKIHAFESVGRFIDNVGGGLRDNRKTGFTLSLLHYKADHYSSNRMVLGDNSFVTRHSGNFTPKDNNGEDRISMEIDSMFSDDLRACKDPAILDCLVPIFESAPCIESLDLYVPNETRSYEWVIGKAAYTSSIDFHVYDSANEHAGICTGAKEVSHMMRYWIPSRLRGPSNPEGSVSPSYVREMFFAQVVWDVNDECKVVINMTSLEAYLYLPRQGKYYPLNRLFKGDYDTLSNQDNVLADDLILNTMGRKFPEKPRRMSIAVADSLLDATNCSKHRFNMPHRRTRDYELLLDEEGPLLSTIYHFKMGNFEAARNAVLEFHDDMDAMTVAMLVQSRVNNHLMPADKRELFISRTAVHSRLSSVVKAMTGYVDGLSKEIKTEPYLRGMSSILHLFKDPEHTVVPELSEVGVLSTEYLDRRGDIMSPERLQEKSLGNLVNFGYNGLHLDKVGNHDIDVISLSGLKDIPYGSDLLRYYGVLPTSACLPRSSDSDRNLSYPLAVHSVPIDQVEDILGHPVTDKSLIFKEVITIGIGEGRATSICRSIVRIHPKSGNAVLEKVDVRYAGDIPIVSPTNEYPYLLATNAGTSRLGRLRTFMSRFSSEINPRTHRGSISQPDFTQNHSATIENSPSLVCWLSAWIYDRCTEGNQLAVWDILSKIFPETPLSAREEFHADLDKFEQEVLEETRGAIQGIIRLAANERYKEIALNSDLFNRRGTPEDGIFYEFVTTDSASDPQSFKGETRWRIYKPFKERLSSRKRK